MTRRYIGECKRMATADAPLEIKQVAEFHGIETVEFRSLVPTPENYTAASAICHVEDGVLIVETREKTEDEKKDEYMTAALERYLRLAEAHAEASKYVDGRRMIYRD